MPKALHRVFAAALFGLVGLGAGCAAKIPIEAAATGGPERLVIDIRGPMAYAAGHAPGSLNIQLGWDQLEDRTLSYVPDIDRPIALRAPSQSAAEQAAAIMKELGYSDVTLFEVEGVNETGILEVMMAGDLQTVLSEGNPPLLIDIRQQSEFAGGVIDEAILVDQDAGPEAVANMDKEARYLIICEGGYRSSQLASWMKAQGFKDVVNVIDGMGAWRDL